MTLHRDPMKLCDENVGLPGGIKHDTRCVIICTVVAACVVLAIKRIQICSIVSKSIVWMTNRQAIQS